MDRDKDKNKTAKTASSACDRTPSVPLHGLLAQMELDAVIGNQLGPVANPDDACKWLKSKGWILSSKLYDHTKIVNILLTILLLPKISPSVCRSGPCNWKKIENQTGPDQLGPDQQLRLHAFQTAQLAPFGLVATCFEGNRICT